MSDLRPRSTRMTPVFAAILTLVFSIVLSIIWRRAFVASDLLGGLAAAAGVAAAFWWFSRQRP